MRIGYPCINRSLGCTPSKTFRLASYTDERLSQTVTENLDCLKKILAYNVDHGLLFLRITSDLVPFASHPVCTFPWQEYFSPVLGELGDICRNNGFRITMHPDQFVLLNSPDEEIVSRSIQELAYQAAILDLMELDLTARLQIHVGGVYGDKDAAMDRFVRTWSALPRPIQSRLVIENDERMYSFADCMEINRRTGIPVIADTFHHALLNHDEPVGELLAIQKKTWKKKDGIPLVDYSSQQVGKRPGAHAEHIVPDDFSRFLADSQPHDFDIMLEIKDKEKSALIARSCAAEDPRLIVSAPRS
ncbi:MAG: UV DNA damage repair endonuclease UvsE [Methanomicrobiales archaeon]|nr:UV DNA damage repair endonuclease UvsE [Methanomicrobiales archaeon]